MEWSTLNRQINSHTDLDIRTMKGHLHTTSCWGWAEEQKQSSEYVYHRIQWIFKI